MTLKPFGNVYLRWTLLIILLLNLSNLSLVDSKVELIFPEHLFPEHSPHKVKLHKNNIIEVFGNEEKDEIEFRQYCHKLLDDRTSKIVNSDQCDVTASNEFELKIDGKMLFTLIMIVAWGVLVRALLKSFDIQLPYTVLLMISGLVIGAVSKQLCEPLHEYTAIARISPKVILFTFLPILIFESAFNIPVHKFYRSLMQILILAFPGMLMCTFFVSFVCKNYFSQYNWTWQQGNLFGCIISATDPVAVVAILRELGVSEVLSVMIEGESLLNDGVAILLYEIFIEFVQAEVRVKRTMIDMEEEPIGILIGNIIYMFFKIAVGGPIFGWLMGKITIFLMSYTFNDPPVEISATIVCAYLTYYIGEENLGVSGVMAVVVLGITMRAERTVISPDSEGPVHHFWEILGYLSNTMLFVLVGIVITETALNSFEVGDLWNLVLLYITIHVSRFLMLLIFYPILKRIGYGLTWQNMVVIMWGGLRGAVGICLALEVFRDEKLCDQDKIGAKMLFQTCGIVFMTLVINGTTTKGLLDLLNLTAISTGRKEEMNNAVRRIHKLEGRWIRIFQLSSKMFNADWDIVHENCKVKNPYKAPKAEDPRLAKISEAIEAPRPVKENETICWNCNETVPNEPTTEEYRELTEDARSRVIKAMSVAYYRLFEVGLISDLAVQILLGDAERVEDQYLNIIHAKNFNKYMQVRGFYPWLKKMIVRFDKDETARYESPKARWRKPFTWLVSKPWFEWCMMSLVIINIIQVVFEIIRSDLKCTAATSIALKYINLIFTILYTIEFFIKIFGYSSKEFICTLWNWIDTLVLIITYVDCVLSFITCSDSNSKSKEGHTTEYLKLIRLTRLVRITRLIKPMIPLVQKRYTRKLNEQLFLGYDIARGFVHSSDEVVKFLPEIIENKRVSKRVKIALDREREECFETMGILQQEYPGIAIAVKTRHACRSVLNTMKEALNELKDEGLLDDTEIEILTRFLESKMKRLWHSPASIKPYSAHVLLGNLWWLQHNDDLYDTILESAEVMSFSFNQAICQAGDQPSGIYIVVAGMVKVVYNPTPENIEARGHYGKIPNTELYNDLTFSRTEEDFGTTGFVIGEAGSLTGAACDSTIIAETSLVVYHISLECIKQALLTYNDPYDSLESHIWRSLGIRRTMPLISNLPKYENLTSDKIEAHLLRSTVPVGPQFNVFDIPHFVSEVIVIEGYAKNAYTNEFYVAPYVVPIATCKRLHLVDNPMTVNRLLIVASDDLTLDPNEEGQTDDHVDNVLRRRLTLSSGPRSKP